MVLLAVFLLTASTVDFYVDPVTYRSALILEDTITNTSERTEILYLEFNCGIPYHELSYQEIDSILTARALITFKLSNLHMPDSLVDTLKRQFTVQSFKQAAQEQIAFIVQFGLHVPDGEYEYTINVISGEKQGTIKDTIVLSLEQFPMSDILLARQIALDTMGTYLRKGNLQVVPHASHIFNDRFTHLFVYYEVYDIIPDTNELDITYTIKANDGTIASASSQAIKKLFPSQAINAGIGIEKLSAGEYTLIVDVEDPAKDITRTQQAVFTITRADTVQISYSGMPYYDRIEYFVSDRDYRAFLDLPEDGKRVFLDKFWSTMNYEEIAGRFEYADEHFYEGAKTGSETARGRVYIRYGEPDEREKSFIEYQEYKPYEHWQYFNGDQYIFIDLQGTSEYTLVWSSVPGETRQPTLYKYLPPTLRDLVE